MKDRYDKKGKRASSIVGRRILQRDPARLTTLRREFTAELKRGYARLKGAIIQTILKEDVLGISSGHKSSPPTPTANLLGKEYKYASVQLDINDQLVRDGLRAVQEHLEPGDVIKVEDDPHVTVRYGLHPNLGLVDKVGGLLQHSLGQLRVTIGSLSVFSQEDQDVLKFDVVSGGLVELNRRLGSLSHTDSYPEYHPHLTVAYLKPSAGAKYVSSWLGKVLDGVEVRSCTVTFSPPDRDTKEVTVNAEEWKFETNSRKVERFRAWLRDKMDSTLRGDALIHEYIERAHTKGVTRAHDDSVKAGAEPILPMGMTDRPSYLGGVKAEFTRRTSQHRETIEKVKLLAGRTFSELEGVNQVMASRMSRSLADGLVKGKSAAEIAADLTHEVDIGAARASVIARTELARAHAEGQLNAMQAMGVTHVGAAVEWTTGDSPCEMCEPLDGVVMSIQEARGLLPRHPQCLCSWSAITGGGEDSTIDAKGVRGAIKASRVAEGLSGGGKKGWAAGVKVSKTRPVTSNTFLGEIAAYDRVLRGEEEISANGWVTLSGGQHVFVGDDGSVHPHGPGGTESSLAAKQEHETSAKAPSSYERYLTRMGVKTGQPTTSGVNAPTASGGATKPTTPVKTAEPPSAISPKNGAADVAKVWKSLPGAEHNQVSIADLHERLGHKDLKDTHSLVNDLRRRGIIFAEQVEGGRGSHGREISHAIDEGGAKLGWLGVRQEHRATFNVFCPTGKGGGVDPACSPTSAGEPTGGEPAKKAKWDKDTETGPYKAMEPPELIRRRGQLERDITQEKSKIDEKDPHSGLPSSIAHANVKTLNIELAKVELELSKKSKDKNAEKYHRSRLKYLVGVSERTTNEFCKTGKGGGVDPHCSPSRSSGGGSGGISSNEPTSASTALPSSTIFSKKTLVGKEKYIGLSVGAAEQDRAAETTVQLAKSLEGKTEAETETPGQKDKKPYDVRVPKQVSRGKDVPSAGYHDIEVKTLIKGGKQVISVHDDALLRKVEHAAANPKNTFHTVVRDVRDSYEGGAYSGSYSGHGLYYKRGSGRYALSKMYKIKDEGELRRLLNMKDEDLPEKARGSLPSSKEELAKLKESASKAAESRKTRDKARKERNKDKLREQARARNLKAKLVKMEG